MNPEEFDPVVCRQTGDGNWEAHVFTDEELHVACYGLNWETDTMTVFSATRIRFDGGFNVRL
jgi:hypothetical protein